ncbi:hypothetical protein OPQ81_007323 [Rhizoctonia solani]|nr:hypothetical protein OPQ81_007323 [Rhizoctonia solani]
MENDKEQLLNLVKEPATRKVDQNTHRQEISEGLIASLQRILDNDGPGELRKAGLRHDNDHIRIQDIGVAPTPNELLCDEDPYLPANFYEAPHHLQRSSAERLFDIQFRLLREEMMAPVQKAIQSVVSDLQKPNSMSTILSNIIRDGGGRYVTPHVQDSIIFSVFTNVTFLPLSLDTRGMSLGIEFDSPPGDAQSDIVETRVTYWERVATKRLTQGALIALIWKEPTGKVDVYVGTVTSTPFELVASARRSRDRISIKVSFFDAAAEFRVLRILQSRRGTYGTRVLIEAPVFYEGVRPFLEALQRNPGNIPFVNYLRHQTKRELQQVTIRPPTYSTARGFSFDLKCLCPAGSNIQPLPLFTSSLYSISQARASLLRGSHLDPSQVDAVIDSLTHELSLIQGVLVTNDVSPILMVAFTNHALDHMLKGVLDGGITDQIIRLGSRFAADERLAGFSLEEMELNSSSNTNVGRTINSARREMGKIEEEMDRLMRGITIGRVPGHEMENYLSSSYPSHYHELVRNTPAWILALYSESTVGAIGWSIAGRQLAGNSIVDFWLESRDLRFLEPPVTYSGDISHSQLATFNRFRDLEEDNSQGAEEQDYVSRHREFVYQHIRRHGLQAIPPIPTSNRLPRELQENPKVWSMSYGERRKLYNVWYLPASTSIREEQLKTFRTLRSKHLSALDAYNKAKEEHKAKLLRGAHIVGCTTTGAAKLVSLLSEMRPKVLVVEEAGQVLESHILASLVGSVEHLILIGDPLQLRPNINSWKLSIDNPVTGKIYRFNQSLMERLSNNGFPMTQLDVQRRMRPSISSLIRQGCYNDEGSIVVLAAYLGQVPKIQQKLQELVTTVVDDRDAELLAQHGLEKTEISTTPETEISKRVLVR